MQQIGNPGEIDKQIIENMNFDGRIKGILQAGQILLKIVDGYCFAAWIHDPIFPDTGIFVIIELADIIICSIAGRNDFYDEIRGPIAALAVQLVPAAYDHKIRLNDGEGIIRQFHIKGGMKHMAWPLFALEIRVQYC